MAQHQSQLFRNLFAIFLCGVFFATSLQAQKIESCIIEQPLARLPDDYGNLDAQVSAMFRVQFRADATIGKIALVLSTHINELDALATDAVRKITFVPQKSDGSAVSVQRIVEYRYSYLVPGWKVNRIGKYCPKSP